MNDKALTKFSSSPNSPLHPKPIGFIDYFCFPFGTTFIFIAIIGVPGSFNRISRFINNFGNHLKQQLPKPAEQKKLGSGLSAKNLLIPFAYSGIEGTLSAIRGVDDNLNIITAGTTTGLLYRASSGNIFSCGKSGLLGLALSSLYCLWKAEEELNTLRHHESEFKDDNYCFDE